jgi:hypothetical protein
MKTYNKTADPTAPHAGLFDQIWALVWANSRKLLGILDAFMSIIEHSERRWFGIKKKEETWRIEQSEIVIFAAW